MLAALEIDARSPTSPTCAQKKPQIRQAAFAVETISVAFSIGKVAGLADVTKQEQIATESVL